MPPKLRVGLVGYGKAGSAVANVLSGDSRFDIRWIARRSTTEVQFHSPTEIPIVGIDQYPYIKLLEDQPIDALVDFSLPASLYAYGSEVARRGITLVSAISAYSEQDIAYARELGLYTRVLCSPNIT